MDTDERFVAKSDYRKAINCRINASDEDSVGTVENIRSNKLIINPDFTNGIVIGSYEDLNAHVIYYFVSGTASGTDSIFKYNPQNEVIETVLQSNILNFSKNKLITGVNVLGDDKDKFPQGLLYWTDDRNPPRKINIAKALTGGYPTIDAQTLDAIKYPPAKYPEAIGVNNGYTNDVLINSNQLKGKSYQFKYRWVYDDGEKSTWSPISPVYIDNTFAAFYNVSGLTQNLNNVLPIKFNSGHHTVDRIQISSRNTNGLDDFVLIADIKKNDVTEQLALSTTATVTTISPAPYPGSLLDDTDYEFYFYNDGIYATIDIIESNMLYSDIPHQAKAQEIVEGNRLVYGNVVSGQTGITGKNITLTAIQPTTSAINNTAAQVQNPNVQYQARLCIGCDLPAVGSGTRRVTQSTYMIRWQITQPAVGCFSAYSLNLNNLLFSKIIAKNDQGGPFGAGEEDHESNLGIINLAYNSGLYASTINVNNIAAAIAVELNSYAQTGFNTVDGGETIVTNGGGGNYSVRSIGANDVDSSEGPKGHAHTGINGIVFSSNGSWVQMNVTMQVGTDYPLDTTSTCHIDSTPPDTANEPFSMYTGWVNALTGDCTVSGDANQHALCLAKAKIGFKVGMGYDWAGTQGAAGRFETGSNSTIELEVNAATHNRSCDHDISNGDQAFMVTYAAWVAAIGAANGKLQEAGQSFTSTICPIAGQQPIVPSFKTGAKHRFGLVYYDEGNRSSSVQLASVSDVYIPKNPDAATATNPVGNFGEWNIDWTINHPPPTWATHYQWVYGGNTLTDDFIQFVTDGVYDGVNALKDDMSGNNFSAGNFGDNILVDISNIKQFADANGGGTVTYDFQEGDILRFVLDQNDVEPTAANNPTITLNGVVTNIANGTPWEFKIIGVVGQKDIPDILFQSVNPSTTITTGTPSAGISGNGIFASPIVGAQHYLVLARETVLTPFLDSSPNAAPTFAGWTLEIYSPKKTTEEDNVIYSEFGEWGTIQSGNHRAIDDPTIVANTWAQHQIIGTQSATGRFRSGDVYLRNRVTRSVKMITPMESFHFSDNFKSDYWDKGRPNAVLEDFKRTRKFATCLYSEPYIPNTNINGLNMIVPDVSFQEFERSYNSIQKIHSRDNNLIIFQEDKISKSLVNKNIMYNMDGSGNIAATDSVLSVAVPYLGNYGICQNPESFASHGLRMYFTDIKRGCVLRLSQDGLTEISMYKMKDYFSDLSVTILKEANFNNYKIKGVFDRKYGEYIISYDKILGEMMDPNNPTIQEIILHSSTLGFTEPTNRWNSFYSYYPEMMCSSGVGIVSYVGGNLYHHDIGVDALQEREYNKFYGNNVSSDLWLVSNVAPSNNKIYKAISTESDNIWSVTIDNKQGQSTNIFTTDFDTRENIHYSKIYNDINSPGGMIEGDKIRSTSALIKLSITSNSLERLFGVNINFSPSERSNK